MNAPFPEPRPSGRDRTRPVRRPDPGPRPEHDARRLMQGGVEARIVLDGTPYLLRITRLGKLILTK